LKILDASLAVKLVVLEEGTDQAQRLWEDWLAATERPVVPPLFAAETASSIRKLVYRDILTEAEGTRAFESLRMFVIDVIEPPGLYERAWQLARDFNRPNIYDCCYLALADLLQTEVWTADEKLANAVGGGFPLLRLLGSEPA
jgi:predicted nucleic acid-binding protein